MIVYSRASLIACGVDIHDLLKGIHATLSILEGTAVRREVGVSANSHHPVGIEDVFRSNHDETTIIAYLYFLFLTPKAHGCIHHTYM